MPSICRPLPIALFCLLCLPFYDAACAADQTSSPASLVQTYTNPMDFPIADPFVVKDGDTYYMYGTTVNAEGQGFDVYVSTDLVNWTRGSKCYTPNDKSWGSHSFWAPEVVQRDGFWYLHFTTFNRKEERRNICIARSKSPLGPFEDYAGPLFDNQSVIDSHIYHDTKTNKDYIYVTPERDLPTGIFAAELSPDFKKLLSEPVQILKGEFGWEDMWIEGTIIHEHKGTLYLMYSGSAFWEGEYSIGYATALSPLGPWTKSATNPILTQNDHVDGPGHNGLAHSPDGSELFMIYHVHAGDYTIRRVAALDRIKFVPTESGPDLLTIPGGPTWQPQPLPSGAVPRPRAISDDFNGDSLDEDRWHVFTRYPEEWDMAHGCLNIKANDGDFWRSHDNGKNVFLQELPMSDFAIETSVTMKSERINEQAFLILWQDEDNYILFAATQLNGDRFSVMKETKGKSNTSLSPNEFGWPLCLRLEKVEGKARFLASKDGKTWTEVAPAETLGKIQPRWVGLGAWAPGQNRKSVARFDWMKIEPVISR